MLVNNISPIYQSIQAFRDMGVRSGAGDASYLAPVYDQILIYFSKLIKAYQAAEEENGKL